MKTHEKELREQFFKPEHFVTDTDNQLLIDIQGIETKLKEMRRQGQSEARIHEWYDEALYQAQVKHWRVNDTKRKAYEAELEKLGAKWRKEHDADSTRALLERQRFEARYRLLNDDEIMREAQAYVNAQGEALAQPPDRLEVLAMELNNREGTHDMGRLLTDKMKANDYLSPWKHTPEGDKLTSKIEAHDTEYGKTWISLDGESLAQLDIEDLINAEIRENDQKTKN